jgi:hypothetical protein
MGETEWLYSLFLPVKYSRIASSAKRESVDPRESI